MPWLLVPLALALSIVSGGATYLRHRQHQIRQAAHEQLQIIADLKVQQLSDWLQERMIDAEWIAATPYAARRASDALAHIDSATTRSMFTGWLEPLRAHRFYERFFLLNEDYRIALEYPRSNLSKRTVLEEPTREAALKAAQTRRPCMTDLHGTEDGSVAHIDFAVPLSTHPREIREPSTNGPADAVQAARSAVLILQVNASTFLYPLLRTWPTPFKTAETMLIRRDGDEVMYLSDLRHRTNAAMRFRLPLSRHELPAAMAIQGVGVHEGIDYHGVPVVAAVRKVPNTPWLMETKVDKAEIYQSLQRETFAVSAVGSALLLALVMGVWMFWRHRQQILLASQLQAERRQRVLAERFEHLMRSAADAILLADENDRILEANEQAQRMYGYELPELQSLTLRSLEATGPGEMVKPPPTPRDATASSDAIMQEARHRRRDGTVFPVEVNSRELSIGGTRCRLAIVRDITNRKEAEEELRQRNEELTRFNQASVGRELRMVELKQEINELCRRAGREPRYALAFLAPNDRSADASTPLIAPPEPHPHGTPDNEQSS